MCGRYVIYEEAEKLADQYQLDGPIQEDLIPRYNAAPGQDLPVVIRDKNRHVELLKWGLVPVWAQESKIGYKMINARAETLFDKPSWKRPVKKQRCIVPANGFFEWRNIDGAKQPFFIHSTQQSILSMAGLYDSWTDKQTGEILKTFTIVTTDANKEIRELHNRMPVILEGKDIDTWLDADISQPEDLDQLLHPLADKSLNIYEVSIDVNKVANDNRKLIAHLH